MPRNNRPRGGRASDEEPTFDPSQVFARRSVVVYKRDGLWNVQSIPAASALKQYVCPGCGLDIAPGVAHTVTWRADGIMGEADDLAARRHWHVHCWKIAP